MPTRFFAFAILGLVLTACGTNGAVLSPQTSALDGRHRTSMALTTLYDFQGGSADGAGPGDILFGPSYALIGTTAAGGHIHPRDCKTTGCGTVFDFDGSSDRLLYRFQPDPDGFHPVGGLLENYGVYYGAAQGGAYNDGMIFSLARNSSGKWVETTLYSFKGPPQDGFDVSGLFYINAQGTLFGTTRMGGSGTACLFVSSGCGTVFELRRPVQGGNTWRESILHSFRGSPDGAGPGSAVIRSDGAFYGTTEFGGASNRCPAVIGCGTIYKLTPRGTNASERVEYSFNANTHGTDGVWPTTIVDGHDGSLYGTTLFGGEGGGSKCEVEPNVPGCGTFYSFAFQRGKNTHDTIIHAFSGIPDGEEPGQITGDGLYGFFGITSAGGSSACNPSFGCGTVFRMDHYENAWTETLWHSFTGTDGKTPDTILPALGRFYGTTYSGGTAPCSCGTIWELSI
jgi:uncharacterized repeat protein (TIGR03803 family)